METGKSRALSWSATCGDDEPIRKAAPARDVDDEQHRRSIQRALTWSSSVAGLEGRSSRSASFSLGRRQDEGMDDVTTTFSYEFCECGKSLIQNNRRSRTYSHSSGEKAFKHDRRGAFFGQEQQQQQQEKGIQEEVVVMKRVGSAPHKLDALQDRKGTEDIEDVVAIPSHDVQDLLSAAPKVLVTPKISLVSALGVESEIQLANDDDDDDDDVVKVSDLDLNDGAIRPPELLQVCERCLRDDCITVKPTVGYYSLNSIRKHCTPDDCWIVAHGNVYDVTRYLKKHPGGGMSILSRVGGVDASADYDFHSRYSKNKLWIKFKVGKVAVCKNPPANKRQRRINRPHSSRSGQTGGTEDESCCIQ